MILNWRLFDGWCVANRLDPFALPARRLYNLGEHLWRSTLHKTEDLDDMQAMMDALDADLRHFLAPAMRADGAPGWWTDEDDAGAEALAFMQTAGRG